MKDRAASSNEVEDKNKPWAVFKPPTADGNMLFGQFKEEELIVKGGFFEKTTKTLPTALGPKLVYSA